VQSSQSSEVDAGSTRRTPPRPHIPAITSGQTAVGGVGGDGSESLAGELLKVQGVLVGLLSRVQTLEALVAAGGGGAGVLAGAAGTGTGASMSSMGPRPDSWVTHTGPPQRRYGTPDRPERIPTAPPGAGSGSGSRIGSGSGSGSGKRSRRVE
jgi:hypothetical protein